MKKKKTKKVKSKKVKKPKKKKQKKPSGKRTTVAKTINGAKDLGKSVGKVAHYYGKIKVGIIRLSTTVSVGQTLYFKGATADFKQKISSMQIDHEQVKSAKKGAVVGIKVSKKVHENDKVYLQK